MSEEDGGPVDSKIVRLELLDEGMSLQTLVTPLGIGMYRLEETEFMAELNHHDIIEAEDLDAALSWASKTAECVNTAIEVRPFWDQREA